MEVEREWMVQSLLEQVEGSDAIADGAEEGVAIGREEDVALGIHTPTEVTELEKT